MSIAQLFKNPNQLTRSENRQIEEAVAGLNAEFENLRQRLRGRSRKPTWMVRSIRPF